MITKEAMCKQPVFLSPTATLREAAIKMKELDCGFIPIGENDRLIGAVTDRDMVIRALAKGKDPNHAVMKDVMSEHIEYCFEEDDLEDVSAHMKDKQIHRLVVLDKNKRLTGIISLGDITRKLHEKELSGKTVEGILADKKRAH